MRGWFNERLLFLNDFAIPKIPCCFIPILQNIAPFSSLSHMLLLNLKR